MVKFTTKLLAAACITAASMGVATAAQAYELETPTFKDVNKGYNPLVVDGCISVGQNDVLARYYKAYSAGDTKTILAITYPGAMLEGRVEKGKFVSETPDYFANSVLPMYHSMGMKQKEICRVSMKNYGDFSMIESKYEIQLGKQITRGIKLVTVENIRGRIISMQSMHKYTK